MIKWQHYSRILGIQSCATYFAASASPECTSKYMSLEAHFYINLLRMYNDFGGFKKSNSTRRPNKPKRGTNPTITAASTSTTTCACMYR